MPFSHIALAIMVAAIYGTAFVAIQLAIDEIPPIMATGYRYLLTVFPFIFFVRRPNVSWALLASYGIVQAVIMFATIFSAIKLGMPPGIASMVVQLQVFFTIGISFFVFGEMPTMRQAIGALTAMIGVAIIGVGLNSVAPILPFIMTIASAFAWGVANTLSKKANPNSMLGFVVWSALFAPVPLFALSMLIEGTQFGIPPIMPSALAIWSILYLAYPTTVLAFTAWVFLLQRHNAAAVTPFALLIPIFGMGSTAIVFGEQLSVTTLIGSTIVFAGLTIAVLQSKQRV